MQTIRSIDQNDPYTYRNIQSNTPASSSDFDQIFQNETIIYADAADDTTFMNPQGVVVSKPTEAVITGTSFSDSSSNITAPGDLDPIFEQAANQYGVRKDLLIAVARAESNFNVSVVSGAGAIGIMQLMPETARNLGVKDPYNATDNIMGGAKYLSRLLSQYNGNISLALAAYNAGSGNVEKYGGIPPFKETQTYVRKILADIGETENSVASDPAAVTIYAVAANSATHTL